MDNEPNAQRSFLSQSYPYIIKYRYLLENVLNAHKSEGLKKDLNIITAKYDEKFINGPEDFCYSQKAI